MVKMNVVEVEFDIDGEIIFYVDELIEDEHEIVEMQIDFLKNKHRNPEIVAKFVEAFRNMNSLEKYEGMNDDMIIGILIGQLQVGYFSYMTFQK